MKRSPIQSYLEKLHEQLLPLKGGTLASYIPELAKVDPDQFAICLVTTDGVAYTVGDSEQPFTIQSISKAFVYAAALADRGQEYVGAKVGVEPSGDAFNSISLHPQTGAPLNPMINAGAIATTSLVGGETVEAQWTRIHGALSTFAGRPLAVDEQVYRSESETGHRNRGIAWMLKNFGIVEGDPMAELENYFRQCSVLVSCRDLAYMAATLANRGVNPLTGERAVPGEYVERVLSVMASCGMYDFAGSWLTEVGMPAKSGVGGGIVAVLPGRFGIAVFSPRLDAKGNSVRGIEVCKRLSRDFGLNIFGSINEPRMALGRIYTGADAPSRRQPGNELKVYLKEQSHRIKYLCLHGFLGVDGVEHVIRRMQAMTTCEDGQPTGMANSFILDMHRVDGITDSAARLLNQARVELAGEGVAVVYSRIHGRPAIVVPLRKAVARDDAGFLSFEDNDLAVEWCENRLIAEANRVQPAVGALKDAVLFKGMPEHLLNEMDASSLRADYAAGEQILRSGQAGDGRIFFIESGHVSILVPLDDGAHQRISTLGPGLIFGEMVLLGQTTRSASVVADTPVRCIVFDAERLQPIWEREPQVKIVLLENLAKDMAQKLRSSTQWIAALA